MLRCATKRDDGQVASAPNVSPRVLAAPPSLRWRLLELEVMRTSTGEANAVAIPAAPVRRQERARCRLHQASERRVGPRTIVSGFEQNLAWAKSRSVEWNEPADCPIIKIIGNSVTRMGMGP